MPTTPNYALRYPSSTDDVRPYEDLQFLATDADTALANLELHPYGASNQAVTSGSDTTTSATYVNMTGTGAVTSFSFTKRRAATRVKLSTGMTWSASAAGSCLVRVGLLLNSVDYDCAQQIIGASQFGSLAGWQYATGVPAGTYTVQARWKRTGGTGTAQRSVNEWLAIEAEEVQ